MGKRFFGLTLSALPFALSLLCAVLFALCFPVWAQHTQKVYRVGILRSGSPSSYLYGPQHDVIRQGLRTLGYIEGSNLLIEYRYAENKLDRLPELARELVSIFLSSRQAR
jgi:putative ABC transport system substrate-binding protein